MRQGPVNSSCPPRTRAGAWCINEGIHLHVSSLVPPPRNHPALFPKFSSLQVRITWPSPWVSPLSLSLSLFPFEKKIVIKLKGSICAYYNILPCYWTELSFHSDACSIHPIIFNTDADVVGLSISTNIIWRSSWKKYFVYYFFACLPHYPGQALFQRHIIM